jgi:hypothetical protein
MTKKDLSHLLLGASTILFLLSVADMLEGTWGEPALKTVAILLVAGLFIRTVTVKP